MSKSKKTPPGFDAKPWEVDLLPDMFGYHLLVDGRRFFIPAERFEAVVNIMAYWAANPMPVLTDQEKQNLGSRG